MPVIQLYRSFSNQIYFWSLVLLAIALPFSPFLITISQIILFGNWLLEGDWNARFQKIKAHKSIGVFLLIFAIYLLLSPIQSEFSGFLSDLKIKLPLLILPIIIATSQPVEAKKIRVLLRFFILSVLVATLFSIAIFYDLFPYRIKDARQISIFISPINLSMLVVVSILTILHWIKTEGSEISKHHLLYIGIIIWLVLFLFLLKSLTGVIILAVTTFILILILLDTIENQFLKLWLIIIMYAIPFFSVLTILNAYSSFYENKDGDLSQLDTLTKSKNLYTHDTLAYQTENGHRVWIYVCEPELEKEWNRRSNIKYKSNDLKGQPIQNTLLRYMTSKGLRKDSVGIWQLSAKDVININHGMTNHIFQKSWSIYPRIYEIIWEIHTYSHTGSANNQSLIQKFVSAKIALHYIKENFWFGVGNTNIEEKYHEYHKNNDSSSIVEREIQTHNQFLRTFMALGIFGFILFILAFLLPPFMENRWESYYFLMIFLILVLAFFNEDILETQAGVTFTAFFYSLFLWGSQRRLL